MNNKDFQYCCGTVELGSFGWDADLNTHQFRELLSAARARNKGYAICTTVASQRGAIKLLKAEKFKALRAFRNPNTGARVTLWGRETQP